MTVRDLMSVVDGEQELVIIIDWATAGFYRCKADSVPPTLLEATIARVFPHHNGVELSIETERGNAV